jgi:hypothetical protein
LREVLRRAVKKIKLLSALRFAVPYVGAAAVAGVCLSAVIPLPKTIGDVTLNVLLPLKAGVAGVMAAALLAFWGFFWAEVINPQTSPEDIPATVRTYRRPFAYIVPTLLLLFVSMGADFYLYLVNQKSHTSAAISFGCFAAAMLMLLGFVVDFSVRTLIQMEALRKANEPNKPTKAVAEAAQQSPSAPAQPDPADPKSADVTPVSGS